MSKGEKITLLVIGIGLAVFLAILAIIPELADLEPVRDRIIAHMSERAGASITYQHAEVSFLPRPSVEIHELSFSMPGKLGGTIALVRLVPEIRPLLTGEFRLSDLNVESPQFEMPLPARAHEQPTASGVTLEDLAAHVLGPFSVGGYGFEAEIKNGRLDLYEGGEPVFQFEDIHGHIDTLDEKVKIDLACKSNLWEGMELESTLGLKDFKAEGTLRVSRFEAHMITEYLSPSAPFGISDSKGDFSLFFGMECLNLWQVQLEGSLPHIALHRGDRKLLVEGVGLKAAFSMDGHRTSVSINSLEFEHSRLTLSGGLSVDRASSRVGLDLEARDVDVPAIREVALAMAGQIPRVRQIFDMVRGGDFSLVTVRSEGASPADLGKLENMWVKGRASDAKIKVPGVRFRLEDVRGEAVISKGILEGKDLGDRLGNSRAQEGSLRLGLQGAEANDPFLFLHWSSNAPPKTATTDSAGPLRRSLPEAITQVRENSKGRH